MKKLLLIPAVLIVVAAAYYFWSTNLQRQLEASSSEFVLQTINELSRNWDPEYIHSLSVSRPEPGSVEDLQVNRSYQRLRRHGQVLQIESIQGELVMPWLPGVSDSPVASYKVTTSYAQGRAEVTAVMIFMEGVWRLQSFYVNSSFFAA